MVNVGEVNIQAHSSTQDEVQWRIQGSTDDEVWLVCLGEDEAAKGEPGSLRDRAAVCRDRDRD